VSHVLTSKHHFPILQMLGYVPKITVAEEKFIEDCQYYIETQTQAAKVLLQAVQGYRQAVEAVLEKTRRPRTQGTRSAR
jgi:hypothetical protein